MQISKKDDGLSLLMDGMHLSIRPWGENGLRVNMQSVLGTDVRNWALTEEVDAGEVMISVEDCLLQAPWESCGSPAQRGWIQNGDIRAEINPESEEFKELLVRWFEWSVFCPILRMHGARQPFEKMEEEYRNGVRQFTSGKPNEIYSYGEEVYDILKKYVMIREKLKGYISGLMEEAHENGMPLIRALFLEYPWQEESWEVQEEYLFGKDILVAPVLEMGKREKEVFFPGEESWISVSDGACYKGGSSWVVKAPLDVIPVFIRQGADISITE